jgi:hypothetical protein
VQEESGGFNGNFERWFAKEEARPKIKLETMDPSFQVPKDEPQKRDLSKPKKPIVQPHAKKKPEAPVLSLERLWQEIQRLKNSKVEYGEFYKL